MLSGPSAVSSNCSWLATERICHCTQALRAPVSPSGYLRTASPRIRPVVRNTSSASASGMLPTKWTLPTPHSHRSLYERSWAGFLPELRRKTAHAHRRLALPLLSAPLLGSAVQALRLPESRAQRSWLSLLAHGRRARDDEPVAGMVRARRSARAHGFARPRHRCGGLDGP